MAIIHISFTTQKLRVSRSSGQISIHIAVTLNSSKSFITRNTTKLHHTCPCWAARRISYMKKTLENRVVMHCMPCDLICSLHLFCNRSLGNRILQRTASCIACTKTAARFWDLLYMLLSLILVITWGESFGRWSLYSVRNPICSC